MGDPKGDKTEHRKQMINNKWKRLCRESDWITYGSDIELVKQKQKEQEPDYIEPVGTE